MTVRSRRSNVAAITLTAAITAGSALLTACGPADGTTATATSTSTAGATATPTGGATSRPTGGATPTGGAKSPSGGPSTPAVNGTAKSKLTISNGTDHVLMNGTSVNFGTKVLDLAWSPNGAKAAFIDGAGDLAISNPDGSGRVIVAKNPGGQTWSHPTWQVRAANAANHVQAENNIFFASSQGGVSRLEGVSATAVNGTPEVLSLNAESFDNEFSLPQTGNVWPNGGGTIGGTVYANSTTGEVFIRDDYLRQQGSVLGKGSEPAMSPDGKDVVFVRSVGGHDHIFEQVMGEKTAKDLTPKATTDYTEPAYSPDGRTLAVRTPSGVATLPADGSAAPTQISTVPGLPAYRG